MNNIKTPHPLHKLLAQLCPEGVEIKSLGEVCDFQNGFAFKSNLFLKNGSAIIRITNINGTSIDLSDVKYFNPKDYKENLKNYEVHQEDILIAMSGATTGKIGLYKHQTTSFLNQRVGKFIPYKNLLNNHYLYHYLLSKTEEIHVIAGGGAQPNLSSNSIIKKLLIPLPPLKVQEKIVDILDQFFKLEAELKARTKQYHYYRNTLLNFSNYKK